MSTERVSDDALEMLLKFRKEQSWPIHLEYVIRELQQRRETDRKVIEAYQNVMGITREDYDNRLERAISELLP